VPGVYILYLCGKVQYVGQTENLKKRLSQHLSGCYDWMRFDEANIVIIEDNRARLLKERELIVRLQPALNDRRHLKPRRARPEWMSATEWKTYRRQSATGQTFGTTAQNADTASLTRHRIWLAYNSEKIQNFWACSR
jgi:excinuclease UvrABC nuclease subunit